jgi:hypothetical protein
MEGNVASVTEAKEITRLTSIRFQPMMKNMRVAIP